MRITKVILISIVLNVFCFRIWNWLWKEWHTWRCTAWMRVHCVWLGWRGTTSLLWRTAKMWAAITESFGLLPTGDLRSGRMGIREEGTEGRYRAAVFFVSGETSLTPLQTTQVTKKLHLGCLTDIFSCFVSLWPQYLKKKTFLSQRFHFHPKIKTIYVHYVFLYLFSKFTVFFKFAVYKVLFCIFLHVYNKINVW